MEKQNLSEVKVSISPERRRALLDEYFSLLRDVPYIRRLIATSTGFSSHRLVQHNYLFGLRLKQLREEYIAGLPFIKLSRCPFTDEIMRHSIDNYDLDGLWWDYYEPVRPGEVLPVSYFAMTGAVHLTGDLAQAPFLCQPGPEVPYVVPRLLQRSTIMAVISSLNIGQHQAYVVTYFARPVPLGIPRINAWGIDRYIYADDKGVTHTDVCPYDPADYDFEIEPWITAGKVRWIAPGDETLAIRDTTSDCPYLGLEGRREITRIQDGEIWW